uniref:GDSL esterase/lipase n=1 Tax=Setaria italica TaxID=4555 RepID=K4ALT5_SETIT
MVQGGAVPALFVFGDSQLDVGSNNNLMMTPFRANFLALSVSPPPPAYRSISNTTENYSIFLNGFNFASGGAGVLDITNKVSLDEQIERDYSSVYEGLVQKLGKNHASIHLARSIFAVGTGGNDIATCVLTDPTNQLLVCSDQQFINSLAKSLERKLQVHMLNFENLYCTNPCAVPSLRIKNCVNSRGCFAEVKSACCGLGDNTAQLICMPMNTLCANRRNHIFWDGGHLTEITTEKLAGVTFNGSVPLVSPVNLKQLTAL